MSRKGKKPKRDKKIALSSSKTPKTDVHSGSSDNETIVWGFAKIDWDGPWGLAACSDNGLCFRTFVEKILSNLETMTWNEIQQAAGGRAHGNNSHPILVNKLSKKARDRLERIQQDDIDEVFSIRTMSIERLYGIRNGRQFQILWYDPWHNDRKRAVYELARK